MTAHTDPRSRARGRRSSTRSLAPAPPRRRGAGIRYLPLTAERWPDLVRLFGPRGACAGCWCMWPRLPAAEFRRNAGAGNRRAFHRLVKSGQPLGVLAYAGGEAVGWCAIGRRERFPRLERSRVMAPVDGQRVWSVVCFFVARGARRAGLSRGLLEAAVRLASRHGARLVEGYPHEPRGRLADAFAWFGLAPIFRRAGFVEVARRAPMRPVLRRVLRARPSRGRSRANG
jgi:GNAT superfamily N-acetyltransferase